MATAAKIQIAIEAQTARLIQQMDKAGSRVSKSIGKMQKSWQQFASGANAALEIVEKIVRAFGEVRELAVWAENISNVADELGLAEESLIGFQQAARRFGSDGDKIVDILREMDLRVGEAARGTGEAKEALDEIGLSARDLERLGISEQFLTIAEAINRIGSASRRRSLRDEIFGGPADEFNRLLSQSRAEIEGIVDEGRKIAGAFDAEAAARFNKQWEELALTFKVGLLPIMEAFATAMEKAWNALTRLNEAIVDSLGISDANTRRLYDEAMEERIWLEERLAARKRELEAKEQQAIDAKRKAEQEAAKEAEMAAEERIKQIDREISELKRFQQQAAQVIAGTGAATARSGATSAINQAVRQNEALLRKQDEQVRILRRIAALTAERDQITVTKVDRR